MALPRCELCGTGTSGCKNERFDEYKERLFKAAIQARNERDLVFIAQDELSKLDSLVSSSRVLPHEDGDDYYHWVNGRYSRKENAVSRIESAIKALNAALESIKKQ